MIGIAALAIMVIVTLSGCSTNKPIEKVKAVSVQVKDKTVAKTVKDTTTLLNYEINTIPSGTTIDMNTPWESSPLGGFKATIEGKGDKAQEEGYSQIIIEDKKANKLMKLTLKDEEKLKLTAKDLEWVDESNLFVIIGDPFGTASKGGKIYKVNILNGETSLYADNANTKEEFMTVHKSEKGFNFEKYVYDDNNFINGHIVSGNLELK